MHAESVFTGIVAFSLLKKATAYGLARYYGFPRIYRKLLLMNRAVYPDVAHNLRTSQFIKGAFRFPNKAAAVFSRTRRSWLKGRATPKNPTSKTPL